MFSPPYLVLEMFNIIEFQNCGTHTYETNTLDIEPWKILDQIKWLVHFLSSMASKPRNSLICPFYPFYHFTAYKNHDKFQQCWPFIARNFRNGPLEIFGLDFVTEAKNKWISIWSGSEQKKEKREIPSVIAVVLPQ